MKRFKQILVAFDSSEDSIQALETAETLAQDHHASITVIYVDDSTGNSSSIYAPATTAGDELNMTQSQPVIPGPGTMPVMPEYTQRNQERIVMDENEFDRILLDAKSRMPDTIEAEYEILTGKPANEITRYAKEHQVDLIVIGNRGLSGLKKWMMGSVSQKVVNEATCAVMVVK